MVPRNKGSNSFGAPGPPAISFQVSCTKAAASAMTRATSFAAAMAAGRHDAEEPVSFFRRIPKFGSELLSILSTGWFWYIGLLLFNKNSKMDLGKMEKMWSKKTSELLHTLSLTWSFTARSGQKHLFQLQSGWKTPLTSSSWWFQPLWKLLVKLDHLSW